MSSTDYSNEIEIYKQYVESIDRLSDRRQTSNSFYLTINTIFIGIIPFIYTQVSQIYIPVISIAGIIVCYTWYRLILSFKGLSECKFKILTEIEDKFSVAPFTSEWGLIENEKTDYTPFTNVEMKIPWVFFCIHLLTGIGTIIFIIKTL